METLVYPATGARIDAPASSVDALLAVGFIRVSEPAASAVGDAHAEPVGSLEDLEPAEGSDGVERPHNGASRKVWAAYVEGLGEDPGTLTRGELIERFG